MNKAIIDMYTKAIEKGEKLPEHFPVLSVKNESNNPLNTAIILISAGVGMSLFVFLAVNGESKLRAIAAIGVIPIIMGVGYLVIYLMSPRKQSNSENAE